MKQLIRWLKSIELMTQNLYEKSSEYFKEDKQFSEFLKKLAQDESYNYHFICCASQLLHEAKFDIELSIKIDENLKKKIEAPLVEYTLLLEAKRLHRNTLLEAIVEIETSELNEILLYAVKMLTKYSVVFEYTAKKIQIHKQRIYRYFKTIKEDCFFINTFKEKPESLNHRILIVDDDEIVGSILKELLKKKVKIVKTRNYKESLKKLSTSTFDVILSNLKLTESNGIDFYKRVTNRNKHLKDSFIFYATEFQAYDQGFLSMHNIPFLLKPIEIPKLEWYVRNKIEKYSFRVQDAL